MATRAAAGAPEQALLNRELAAARVIRHVRCTQDELPRNDVQTPSESVSESASELINRAAKPPNNSVQIMHYPPLSQMF